MPDIGIEAEVLEVDEILDIENEFVDGVIQAFDCGFKLEKFILVMDIYYTNLCRHI